MEDSVIQAVSTALHAAFGDDYRYYRDPVQQGASLPCFFIAPLEPVFHPLLGARSRLDVPLDVHYFASQEGDYGELSRMAGRLPAVLEVVELPGGPVRGREMRWHIEEGVLHFFVTYTVFLMRQDEETDMGEIAVETNI